MWELFTVLKINGQGFFLKFSSDTEDILKDECPVPMLDTLISVKKSYTL